MPEIITTREAGAAMGTLPYKRPLVEMARRIVDRIEFHDKPIDAHGTTGVRIWWLGRDKPSLVAVDKAMDVVDPDPLV